MALKDHLSESSDRRSAQYRRGAIMGLTVAESFILIAFVLLLLLALWRSEETDRAKDQLDLFGRLTPGEQQLVRKAAEEGWLEEILAHRSEKATFSEIVEEARELRKKKERGAVLVEKRDLIELVEAVEGLPPVQREEIVELVSADGYEEVVNWARQAAKLIERGHSIDDLNRALYLLDRLSEEEIANIDALKSRIRNRLGNMEAIGRQLAEEVERTSGEQVRQIGGDIDPATGAVTLPDTALFGQGSARITPELDRFLRSFCVDWLRTLKDFGPAVGDIRIEGHASSEWEEEPSAQEKFLKNMDLSQRRASAVLTRCLRLAGDTDLGRWSREHLRAVGYSSADPVIVDGTEDERRSRRVVFRAEVDRDRILRGLKEDVEPEEVRSIAPTISPDQEARLTLSNLEPPWASADRIEGQARIIDGDTLEIDGVRVRLQGLHAPELTDPGGSSAGQFLREFAADRHVVCLLDGTQTYERQAGRCFLDGADIAERSVRAGLSRDCPRYSNGRYAPFETPGAIASISLPSYCQ